MTKPAQSKHLGVSMRKKASSEWNSDGQDRGSSLDRDEAFQRAILSIPSGRVSTYGDVAAAAGYPRYHRAVARLLHQDKSDRLPWHRVLGADGKLKTSGSSAKEQRARLRLEGVKFKGDRVEMKSFLLHGRKTVVGAEDEVCSVPVKAR